MDATRANLTTAVDILHSTNKGLRDATADFDRLKTVLKSTRVFDVVTLHDVVQAKQELSSEIEPKVNKLLEKIEQELARLERREKSLVSRAQLQEVRLHQNENKVINSKPPSPEQLKRLKELQEKKAKLTYNLKTVNLQKQKARINAALK